MLEVFALTDRGSVKSGNEDSFLVGDKMSTPLESETQRLSLPLSNFGELLAVSDGTGTQNSGKFASALAIQTILDAMKFKQTPLESRFAKRLVKSFHAANQAIIDYSGMHEEYGELNATATVAALLRDSVFIAQVGNSRAYLMRNGQMVQATRDQTLANWLLEKGRITEEEASQHPFRSRLLQSLGKQSSLRVPITSFKLRVGDYIVLCSDGLFKLVKDSEMKAVIRSAPSVERACAVLGELANQRGGRDNITVVIAKCVDLASPPATCTATTSGQIGNSARKLDRAEVR